MMARSVRITVVALAVSVTAGCDLRITNAGPIADETLNQPAAAEAIVNGMSRSLSRALGFVAYTGGAAAREIVGSGVFNVMTFGITLKQQNGILEPTRDETNEHWRYSQQARWVAQDGTRRLRDVLGPEFARSGTAATALIHVGFSHRLLGENMCDAVIDGGPREPRAVYFERAEAAFSEAVAIADAIGDAQLANTARAGRASVRIWLGDWGGAVTDAMAVPSSLVYSAAYSGIEQEQYNRIFWANGNQALRAHSVVGTFFEDYYRETGDQRTSWSTSPAFPNGTRPIPWYFQTKYLSTSAPINLVTGREMRLIRAEADLRAGDWQGALERINALRAETGVVPWDASSATESWTALMKERSIELWLEGRRLGDLFRWNAGNTPGQFEDVAGRDLCFPIGISEFDGNPNLRN